MQAADKIPTLARPSFKACRKSCRSDAACTLDSLFTQRLLHIGIFLSFPSLEFPLARTRLRIFIKRFVYPSILAHCLHIATKTMIGRVIWFGVPTATNFEKSGFISFSNKTCSLTPQYNLISV